MSDIRHDPIEDRWVAMADNRRDRPIEFIPVEQTRKRIICPFCLGNESETPLAQAIYNRAGAVEKIVDEANDELTVDWLCRVVANKFPTFSTISDHPESSESSKNGLIDREVDSASGLVRANHSPGIQELIIPTPRHLTSLSELNDPELEVASLAQRDRLAYLRDLDYIKHAMLFLNCRSAAGASLGHVHWQLIGTPLMNSDLQQRVQRDVDSLKAHGKRLVHRLAEWELTQSDRVIKKTDHFVVLCPYASRFPLQVRIVPLNEEINFLAMEDVHRFELARLCQMVVRRMESLLDNPAYNVLFHVPPFEHFDEGSWYVELFPRLTIPAGYEWGTGVWINPVSPEKAARAMRAN